LAFEKNLYFRTACRGNLNSNSMAQQKFDELDVNEDGFVDSSELEALISEISENSNDSNNISVEDMMSKADTDEDGVLSTDEFSSIKPPPPPKQNFNVSNLMRGQETNETNDSRMNIMNLFNSSSENEASSSKSSLSNSLSYYIKNALNSYSSNMNLISSFT